MASYRPTMSRGYMQSLNLLALKLWICILNNVRKDNLKLEMNFIFQTRPLGDVRV